MSNSRQAKKRVKQAEKNRQRNTSYRSIIRTSIKKLTKAIGERNITLAKTYFNNLQSILDRYETKGLIHKNKAARHKTHLITKIKVLETYTSK